MVFLNNLADFPERMSAGKPAPTKFHHVEAIVQKLVGIRLNRHAKEVARGCAKASLYWPIVVHAFADGRSARTEAYVKLLNLGSVTGPVIDRGGGRGSTRKLVPDSRSGFALYVFEILDRERIRAGGRCVYPTSDDEPASTDESISMVAGLEKPDESSQGLSDRRDVAWPSVSTVQLISMAARLGKTEVSSPGLSGWRDAAAASESNIKWISMAARLKMLDQSSEGLTRWHDAAMAYCDHLCSGNYAGFDWPTSVHERSRRRYKVPVSSVVKKTLSEILYSGFEALVATTKAVESPAPGQTGDVKGESAIQSATVSVIS